MSLIGGTRGYLAGYSPSSRWVSDLNKEYLLIDDYTFIASYNFIFTCCFRSDWHHCIMWLFTSNWAFSLKWTAVYNLSL